MPDELVSYDYSALPNEVWLKILAHLDCGTLLALEASSLRFESLVYDHVICRKIHCSPNVGTQTLSAFFTPKRTPFVKELHFDNCFMTNPSVILHYANICANLTYLSCIGCRVNPAEVLALIIRPLSLLQRIEWTLCGLNEQPTAHRDIALITRQNPEGHATNLRWMYMELSFIDPDNFIISSILKRCSVLEELHFHITHGSHYEAIDQYAVMAKEVVPHVQTFTYSQEEVTCRQPRWPYMRFIFKQPVNKFKVAASILGNMTINMTADAVNCVFLSDVVGQPEAVLPFEQVLLTIRDPENVSPEEIAEVSTFDCWSKVRSLALTQVPPGRISKQTNVGPALIEPLGSLFASCRSVTQLNLSSFHFQTKVNCCAIVASTMPQLQALALTQCGINYKDSVDGLASGCVHLEELDVRVSRDGLSGFCTMCSEPLCISESSMEALTKRSQLRRLSLFYVRKVQSFDFIKACRLTKLRVSMVTWTGEENVYQDIGDFLCANTSLSSFTFMYNWPHWEEDEFCREILRAKHLRILSLYHELRVRDDVVIKLAEKVTSSMPCLEVLHLHYNDMSGADKCLSWIVNERCHGEQTRSFTVIKYCLFCDLSTYIGLASAHNRSDSRF
uniref:Putative secreted protein ovary overexpressed n=1 Tax=Rhipicephalus microplus TaxID=6941 RepID=A0A6M2D4X4_RHIMP